MDKTNSYTGSRQILVKTGFFVLVLFMISMPFNMKISNGLLVVCVLISLFQYFLEKERTPIQLNGIIVLMVGYFMIEVIGIIYTKSDNLKDGLALLERHLPFIFIPIVLSGKKLNILKRDILLGAFVGGFFIASIYCVIININLSLIEGKIFHEYYFSYERVSEPIGMQAVYFALYISLCILCILDILRRRYLAFGWIQVMLSIMLLVYFLFIIVSSGARTAIVSLLVILVITFVFHGIKHRAYKYILVAGFVPVIFVFLILFNPVVSSRFEDLKYSKAEGTSYDSYFARINIWKPSIELIKDNIWFGVGTGDQEYELMKKFNEHGYAAGIEFKFNTHNQYMQTMLGHGFLGLLCLLAILVLQLCIAFKRSDLLYLSFVLLFSFAGLTESLLNRNKGVILFLVFSFLFYQSSTQSQASKPGKEFE